MITFEMKYQKIEISKRMQCYYFQQISRFLIVPGPGVYQAYREPFLPPSSPPFTPLSMWMESTVGITSPLKDQKIADFLRKEPHALSWKVLPDYSNRSSQTITPQNVYKLRKKKPSIVNQQCLENKFKCKRCDAYYTGDTIYLLSWGSINTLHLKKQQKRAISQPRWR